MPGDGRFSLGTLRVQFEVYSGTGNRFLLTESVRVLPWAGELAPRLCQPGLVGEQGVDGLLVLDGPLADRPRMTIFNADGSRPEACGNGLRCVGWHLARQGEGERFFVQTDSGPRSIHLKRRGKVEAELYTDMGPVTLAPLDPPWPRVPGLRDAFAVNVGNPHAVLLVDDERELPAGSIAQGMERHPTFPRGVNLGLLAQRDGSWRLRVHERGVGETSACGTGACAAVAVLAQLGRALAVGDTTIEMRGGPLSVGLGPMGKLELLGAATYLGSFLPPEELFEGLPWASCFRS